ncbi:MAG: phosphodiester glycosidase family protein [Armatimonadota bacterium]
MTSHGLERSRRPAIALAAIAAITAAHVAGGAARGQAAQTAWRVRVNGQEVACTPPPRTNEGHVLLPASLLKQHLGITVAQDAKTGVWTLRSGSHELRLRTWQRDYVADGQRRRAAWPPELIGNSLFVPLQTVAIAFELPASTTRIGDRATVDIGGAGVTLTDLRQGAHADYFRVVLEFSGPPAFTWKSAGQQVSVEVTNVTGRAHVRHLRPTDPVAADILEQQMEAGPLRLEITLAQEAAPRVYTLADPPRLVVDLYRKPTAPPGPEVEPPRLVTGPAATVERRNFSTPAGAVAVTVVRVDLSQPGVEVRPALAGQTVMQKARPSTIARREGASAAINGGFFAKEGPPLGMLVIDGEWIKHPSAGRTVLGITQDNKVLMERVFLRAGATFPKIGRIEIDALNRRHVAEGEAVLFTDRWGPQAPARRHNVKAAISRAQVVERVDTSGAAIAIPEGGYVLSATGGKARALAKAQVGTTVDISLGCTPPWNDLKHALGGGPRLVAGGRKYCTAEAESFRGDVKNGRALRSAVGLDAQGRLMLVAVSGKAGGSAGMSLDELASTMLKLGAVDAMNLDGGSSSALIVNGQLASRSTGWERAVSNALLVFLPRPDTRAAKPPDSD